MTDAEVEADTRPIQLAGLVNDAIRLADELAAELDRKDLRLKRVEWLQIRLTQASELTNELRETI